MQPPVLPRTHAQEKTHTPHELRNNATFAEVVGILENAQVAEEGLDPRHADYDCTRNIRSPSAYHVNSVQ